MRSSRLGYPLSVAVISLVGIVMIGGNALAAQGDTTRISVDSTGGEATGGDSAVAAISDDGRYVTFHSDADNLVTGDTNGSTDVFVHDRDTDVTTRVSVDSTDTQATGGSFEPAISGDGRYVTFASWATDLVPGDTNGGNDVFVHDRDTGLTTRVSVDSAGTQAGDGSLNPAISDDGRYVTFHSSATDLVDGDTNGHSDVFVHDRQSALTNRVSVHSTGTQANDRSSNPTISGDGRHVTFESTATNLVTGDTNGLMDVFVHDHDASTTSRVSVDSAGTQATDGSYNPAISGDARYVTFQSYAPDLVTGDTNSGGDVFVRDLDTGDTTRVSIDSAGTQATGQSFEPAISGDGRLVTFQSEATNLVSGDTNITRDVFVHDRTTGDTSRISVTSGGTQATGGDSYDAVISGDGRHVAFASGATDLVAGDTNGTFDVFVHQYLADPVVVTTTTTEPVTTTTTDPSSATTTTTPPEETPADAFIDDDNSVFEDDINTIAAAGITMGCNPPLNDQFCPNDPLTRGQMGAFLNRVFDLMPSGVDWFTDDNANIFNADINSAAAAGITRGCNPPGNTHYCPNDNVTRGQMAAFLHRSFNLAPSNLDWFTDDNNSIFRTDINSAAAAGITRGCNPPVNDRYCPDDYLTRGQMAALLNRAITHNNEQQAPG